MAFSRRTLVKSAIAAGATAALPAATMRPAAAHGVAAGANNWAMAAGAPFLPYTASSFFRSTTLGAPVDATATAQFQTFMRTHPDQRSVSYPKINGGVATSQWGTTFHLGSSTDPIWRLTGPGVRPETQILASQGFHMADSVADRIPTGTQDRPIIIADPVFGYSMHCADAAPNKRTRTISVSSSGLFWHASNGLDRRNPRSTDKRNFCSRGRIVDSMVIRGDLVRAAQATGGSLGHVMQLFFVETDARMGFCHPMVGTEGKHIGGWGAEGVRIAVKPSINLTARGLTGGALVIARTLQDYGCYIGDNSGSSSTLKGEQAGAGYSPYAGTNVSSSCLSGKLSWTDFYVLPKSWQ